MASDLKPVDRDLVFARFDGAALIGFIHDDLSGDFGISVVGKPGGLRR
jgi:hypothetical protein